ncbi:YidH family protein [Rhodococcus ruber]|uniref:YidH family protein n=1 Tax=Rhodococcus ruber TaxID=1830 RepID=UPI003CCB3079
MVTDQEPDYRFTLANERTFLAWIRTALALLAGGVAVGHLFASDIEEFPPKALGGLCVGLATVLAVGAFQRWRRVQAAMRRSEPLPTSTMIRITVGGVCIAAVTCVVLLGA